MIYEPTPVTWKPSIRPTYLGADVPSTLVGAKKAATVLGVTVDQLLNATMIDWRGLKAKHTITTTTNKTTNTYSCDQVLDLMIRMKRPGRAAFERYLLDKLTRDIQAGAWLYNYPDSYIRADKLMGTAFVPPLRPLAPAVERLFR